jgi:hypothetical protein
MKKFIITEDEKKEILNMYNVKNDEPKDVESQVEDEVNRLGYDIEDVEVVFDDEPNRLNESDLIKKAIVICSIAAGVVSCRKPEARYIYQYSYETESSQEYEERTGKETRITNFISMDHELNGRELEELKQKCDASPTGNGEEPLDSKIKLYAIDTSGEWG